jgi:6-pyruvoyltetrahydropterin/6-carboxytetrahydropterin synthase
MYKIKVEAYFSSAHNLRGYRGKCEDLHGHNWKVELVAAKLKLDKTGMVMDFKHLKKKLNAVSDKLDHKYLNGMTYFKKVNPTSENIAKFIYDSLKVSVPGIVSVTVWENETSCATYEPNLSYGKVGVTMKGSSG